MHTLTSRARASALALFVAFAALAGGAAARGADDDADPAPVSRVLARGDAVPDEEGDDEAEEPLRKLTVVRHMEIRARDMRLRETAKARFERIAARYHRATGVRLVVTGGYRTVRRQAELMARKLANGDDIAKLYAERAAAIEIRDAYREAAARGERKPALVAAIEAVIEAQIARGVYVSLHIQGRAADVRSRGLTDAQLEALIEAVEAEPGAVLVDERDGAAPHLHLRL
jgi:hypothetical protein